MIVLTIILIKTLINFEFRQNLNPIFLFNEKKLLELNKITVLHTRDLKNNSCILPTKKKVTEIFVKPMRRKFIYLPSPKCYHSVMGQGASQVP